MSGLRAITLWQPWASLVAEGVKTIETRPKQHPWRSAIGETLAIHAARRLADDPTILGDYRVRGFGSTGRALVGPGLPEFRSTPRLEGYTLPLGAVVATCRLVDVVPMLAISDEPAPPDELDVMDDRLLLWRASMPTNVSDQRPYGDFAPGRWALLLDQVQKTAPMPCRGYQGLWTVPPAVADNLLGLCA